MNSDQTTIRTTNAANEDNNNGHPTLQSDEDTNDRTSGTSPGSGAVQDNVIFQAKSKQQVALNSSTDSVAIIQEQTATSMS